MTFLNVLGEVNQSNARFGLTESLEVHLDHVRMLSGKGKRAEKTKGRLLTVLSGMQIVYSGCQGSHLVLGACTNNCDDPDKW